MPVPFRPIICSRVLYYHQSGFILSPLWGTIWTREPVKADCYETQKHANPPEENGACGLYGQFKIVDTFEGLIPVWSYYMLPADLLVSCPVVVLCEHYGKACIHEKGLRSEYARIIGLVNVTYNPALVEYSTMRYTDTLDAVLKKIDVPIYDRDEGQKIINLSLAENL